MNILKNIKLIVIAAFLLFLGSGVLLGNTLYWAEQSGAPILKKVDIPIPNPNPGNPNITVDPGSVTELFSLGLFTHHLKIAEGKVYWSHFRAIKRANLDGSNEELLVSVSDAFDFILQFALDLPNERLYWVERGSNLIKYVDLSNPSTKGSLGPVLGEPRGIAIDVDAGEAYYSLASALPPFSSDIYMIDIATEVSQLIAGSFSGQAGYLALDAVSATKVLYLINVTEIQKIQLDGVNAVELIHDAGGDPFGSGPRVIAFNIPDQHVYWTGGESDLSFPLQSIKRLNLDGTGLEEYGGSAVPNPHTLALSNVIALDPSVNSDPSGGRPGGQPLSLSNPTGIFRVVINNADVAFDVSDIDTGTVQLLGASPAAQITPGGQLYLAAFLAFALDLTGLSPTPGTTTTEILVTGNLNDGTPFSIPIVVDIDP